eukprot:g1689.t1
MTDVDELYTLKNNFWTGNFQLAIQEGGALNHLGGDTAVERDVLIYRSYCGLKQYNVVLDEVADDAPTPMLAVKLLANFLSSEPEDHEVIMLQLKEWQSDPRHGNNPTLQLIAATIYSTKEMYKEALQAIRHTTTMEMYGMMVHIFLRMARPDLAEKQVKSMQQIDEDSSMTQLSCAWLYLAQGGAKYQEALYLFQELQEKTAPTPLLLNAQAVANIHLRNFEAAEQLLVEALSKDARDPTTLANLITTHQHLGKPNRADVVKRYSSQLKREAPQHPTVAGLDTVSSAFDRVAAGFAAE